MLPKKITSTITSEVNWRLKNFFLTIQMCQVSSCDLEDYFGVRDTSILPRVLRLSRKIGIPLIRGGEQLMDMTCVENVALAIRLALEAKEAHGQVYNITNGETKDL